MPTHTIAASETGQHDITLTPATVETFVFTRVPAEVEILTDGAAPCYVSVDGTTPTVSGKQTRKLLAAPSARRITHGDRGGTVKVISPGAPTISVTWV